MEENQFLRWAFIANVNHAHVFVKHQFLSTNEITCFLFSLNLKVLFLTQDFMGQFKSYTISSVSLCDPRKCKYFQ